MSLRRNNSEDGLGASEVKPFAVHQGFSNSALLTFWADNSLLCAVMD